jgi:anti-anti-sigma factor
MNHRSWWNSRLDKLPNGVAILTVSGEIELAVDPNMISRFQELADKGMTDVTIDARELTFIESSGLNGLIEGKRIIHERGSKLVLVSSRPGAASPRTGLP